MKKIALLLLFLNPLLGNSQNIKIIDSTSKLPIPFATIKMEKDGKFTNGMYTDENGDLSVPIDRQYDEIIISCIGFETKKVAYNQHEKSIELAKKTYSIDEVIINNKNNIQIGYSKEQKSSNSVGVAKGLEIAVFVENKLDYEATINSVQFTIKKTKEKVAFRVHLYTLSDDNLKPNEDLLQDNRIYYIASNTHGLISINLSEYNIVLPKKGVFVGIEGLSGAITNNTLNKKNSLIVETHKSSLPIYQERHQLENIGWVNINKWLPNNYYLTFNKKYDEDKLFVPSFGLKINKIEKD